MRGTSAAYAPAPRTGPGSSASTSRAQSCGRIRPAQADRLAALRDGFEASLAEGFPGLVRHGHREPRLPNTATVAFPGVDANALLGALAEEVAASAGAACRTGAVHSSTVLTAVAVDAATAMATVRFSLGRFTTAAEVEAGARRVLAAVRTMKRARP